MDNSGRSNGSGTSNTSDFMSGNAGTRSNHQQSTQYAAGSSSFMQSFQASQSTTDQQRIYQMKMQEIQLKNMRQNQFQNRVQQHTSPSSNQQQNMPQPNQEQQRRSSPFSPGTLLMSPTSLASPNFGRPLLGSPSNHSFMGSGSISSMKSVFTHFQEPNQSSRTTQFPPAPPFAPTSLATAASSQKDEKKISQPVKNNGSQTNARNKITKEQLSISIPKLGPDESADLVNNCDWIDKTLWVTRQVLGGPSVNPFLRATAAVQRVKKQRTKQNSKGDMSSKNLQLAGDVQRQDKKRGTDVLDPEAAQSIKKEVMNVKTAKKMKLELEMGINFSRLLHSTIRTILREMDPSLPDLDEYLMPESKPGSRNGSGRSTRNMDSGILSLGHPGNSSTVGVTSQVDASGHSSLSNAAPNSPLTGQQENSCASPGNPSGSTLRKNRKKKIPPNTEPPIDLPEFDSTGKRLCTKKEHFYRLFECIRYRGLKQGDVVAARVSSRNLWILARVLQIYPASNLPLLDFVRLPDSKREQLYKEKVLIKDVEDKQDDTESAIKVARSLILPLPRSVSEAADWGQRYKKGSRVYALYPNTTALYTATILDATTYARDDDDIIVVRFDGDEPDASGTIPSCHIPSRFVTSIPKGFPGELSSVDESNVGSFFSASSKKKKGSGTDDWQASSTYVPPPPADNDLHVASNFDDLNFDDHLTGIDDFDDLDFDLLGDS